MKVNKVICDICGRDVRNHGRHEYQIRKRFFETELKWRKIDLCEKCWNEFNNRIINKLREEEHNK